MINKHPWNQWYEETLETLSAIQEPAIESLNDNFLKYYYKSNWPTLSYMEAKWPIVDWTWKDLCEKVGSATIEYQAARASNPDYEMQAPKLKVHGSFNGFVDRMLTGAPNDVYITANNYVFNRDVLKPLYEGIGRLPTCLYPSPEAGFFWIGSETVTPLHHDLTNNMMCQVMGDKLVRCVPPSQFNRLRHRAGVHSHIGWLADDYVMDEDILYVDYRLKPGMCLFLPVGWWHCVRTTEPSITVVYTNFLWNNSFHANFHC